MKKNSRHKLVVPVLAVAVLGLVHYADTETLRLWSESVKWSQEEMKGVKRSDRTVPFVPPVINVQASEIVANEQSQDAVNEDKKEEQSEITDNHVYKDLKNANLDSQQPPKSLGEQPLKTFEQPMTASMNQQNTTAPQSMKNVETQKSKTIEQPIKSLENLGNKDATQPKSSELEQLLKRPLEFVHIPKTGGSAIELAAAKAGVTWGLCHFQERPLAGPGCVGKDWDQLNLKKANPEFFSTVDPWWEPWHTPPAWIKHSSPYVNKTLFAVVRNPYTRFISEYYCPYNGLNPVDWDSVDSDGYHDPMAKPPDPTKAKAKAKKQPRPRKPYTPDTLNAFLKSRLDHFVKWTAHYVPQADYIFDKSGNQVVEHVLRFENLTHEFPELMGRYRLPVYLNETINESNSKVERRFTIEDLYPDTIALINKAAAKDFERFGYEKLKPGGARAPSTNVGTVGQSSAAVQTKGSKPSVAFLFMTTDALNEELWRRWFPARDDGRYSIVVHTVPSNTTVPLGPFFCEFAIPSVVTKWYELYDGMIQSLSYAYERDRNAEMFVYVSASSVPLVSFDTFYDTLIEDTQKSRFCFMPNRLRAWEKPRKVLSLGENQVRKAEMWSVLTRRDVQLLLEGRSTLDKWNKVFISERKKTWDWNVGAPDECLFSTYLHLQGSEFAGCPKQSVGREYPSCCSTYVHWQYNKSIADAYIRDDEILLSETCELGWRPCTFHSLREEGLVALQKRGYLMLRKIPATATVINNKNESVPLNHALFFLHSGNPVSRDEEHRQIEEKDSALFSCPAPTI